MDHMQQVAHYYSDPTRDSSYGPIGVSIDDVGAAYPLGMLFHVYVDFWAYAKRQAYLLS